MDWQPLNSHVLAGWRSPYWLRWQLTQPADGASHVLRISLRAASQPYWNGHPLPANGIVGRTGEQEHPGLIDSVHVLPPSAGSGVDELLVLASSHHQWPGMYATDASVEITSLADHGRHLVWPWLIAALAMGALAAACLYFLALRGKARAPAGSFLLALCTIGLATPAIEAWRPLLGYAYPWHGPRLLILLALHLAAAILLPAYLARQFRVAIPMSYRLGYLVMLAAATCLPSFDSRSAAVLLLSLLGSVWLLRHARDERHERWPIMALLLAGALSMPLLGNAFLDGPYFLMLTVLMGYLLVRHATRLRELDMHNAALREEGARLSLQLLQRGIQPHWLMNTLTCLQELIDQSPARASRLVESLAEQFDRLRESSGHQCVPLEQELALCRNHLDIISLALDHPMTLDIDAANLYLSIPPGVLHAQVENALTHAGAMACAKRPFRLRVQNENGWWILELRSARGHAPHRGHGTGAQYIEASLAAAFPGNWTFAQGVEGDDWRSRIELRCAS
ncbi:histidine kinase [Xanthomonas arboricola]|uniref:histidine kinase n=1 Tax=Xanthomonas arboricola TaxID=56448 RepID=UPI001EE98F8C|nr:sensor histidine kinase [Xanthomonas arboricola]